VKNRSCLMSLWGAITPTAPVLDLPLITAIQRCSATAIPWLVLSVVLLHLPALQYCPTLSLTRDCKAGLGATEMSNPSHLDLRSSLCIATWNVLMLAKVGYTKALCYELSKTESTLLVSWRHVSHAVVCHGSGSLSYSLW